VRLKPEIRAQTSSVSSQTQPCWKFLAVFGSSMPSPTRNSGLNLRKLGEGIQETADGYHYQQADEEAGAPVDEPSEYHGNLLLL